MSYNGWSNYETWNCNLWFDDFTDMAVECLKESFDSDNPDDTDKAIDALTNYIQATVEDFKPNIDNSFYSDILNQAIRQVNFREIAECYISDLAKEVLAELKEDHKDTCDECGGSGEVDCDPAECVTDECHGKTPCNTCNQRGK